jgi:hypothetical protein
MSATIIGSAMLGAEHSENRLLERHALRKKARRKTSSLKDKLFKKKSKAPALLQQLCRPYFPENLDLIFGWRGDAACARQGSSRDLDHQTSALRPA